MRGLYERWILVEKIKNQKKAVVRAVPTGCRVGAEVAQSGRGQSAILICS